MAQFPLLPDSVTETWEWLTDVISATDGTEQRFSLRDSPRITQSLDFEAVTQAERRDLYRLLAQDLRNPNTAPLFAWGVSLSASAASGTDTVSVDTTLMSLNLLDRVVLMNPDTRETEDFIVIAMTDTSIQFSANLSQDVDERWIAFKGMVALTSNDTAIGINIVAGQYRASMDSWQSPEVQRTGTNAVLTTFNSLPVLERDALAGSEENLEFERDVIDFETGSQVLSVTNTNVDVTVKRRFQVNRSSSEDIDYWRLFLDTVKGRWKAFLMSTQLEDMTLATPLVAGASTMSINETDIDTLFHAFASFQNFEILYSDDSSSQHTITFSGAGTVNFTPALPNDPKVANVKRISYLLKVRMADRQQWTHGPVRSVLAFDVFTTDDG